MCSCIANVDHVAWHMRRWGEFSRFFLCLTGMLATCRYVLPPQELPPVQISIVLYNSALVPVVLGATLRPHVLANVPPTLFAQAPWRWLFPRLHAIKGSGPQDLDEHGWERLTNIHAQGVDLAFLVTAGHPEPSISRLLHAASRIGALLRPIFIDGLPKMWPKGDRVPTPTLMPLTVHVGDARPVLGANAWSLDELLAALQGRQEKPWEPEIKA